ncbi:MAG: hypothetical protein U9R28_08920 [Pseudomonadota bacterium]|nr:hypothetical protein [Pseudomonadota bacterium]
MQTRHTLSLSFLSVIAGFMVTTSQASEPTRAVLLNSIQGAINQTQPQPVKLLITQGQAKGCKASGTAFLNKQRMRYEFTLAPINCIKNGQKIPVGTIVRGQHNIKGTMANSGMGRKFFISNKGVAVSLSFK